MKLLNYSLVKIEDNSTKKVGLSEIEILREGTEYQTTSQVGEVYKAESGAPFKDGERVWFFHKAVDNKTDYFGELMYAIPNNFILAIERGGVFVSNERIIGKPVYREGEKTGAIILEDKPQVVENIVKVESVPKGCDLKKGDYILVRKNSAYYIDACDRHFIEPDRVIATLDVELSGEMLISAKFKELKNGHHILEQISAKGGYEKVRGIFLQRKNIYQPEWCDVVMSTKFKKGDRVFATKSTGGDIELNKSKYAAVKSEQLYFAE